MPGWQAARFIEQLDPKTVATCDEPLLLIEQTEQSKAVLDDLLAVVPGCGPDRRVGDMEAAERRR